MMTAANVLVVLALSLLLALSLQSLYVSLQYLTFLYSLQV